MCKVRRMLDETYNFLFSFIASVFLQLGKSPMVAECLLNIEM